jgi:hypothetical protein
MPQGGTSPAWPTDVAVPRRTVERRASVPIAESWVLPKAEVERWFDQAEVGEVLLYGGGPRLLQGETSALVRDKALAGLAHPTQPRLEDKVGYAFKVRKLADAAPATEAEAAETDGITERIFAEIAAAAEAGRRCPSDLELAKRLELPTRAVAAGRVARLAVPRPSCGRRSGACGGPARSRWMRCGCRPRWPSRRRAKARWTPGATRPRPCRRAGRIAMKIAICVMLALIALAVAGALLWRWIASLAELVPDPGDP